jgi:hypothetical protein
MSSGWQEMRGRVASDEQCTRNPLDFRSVYLTHVKLEELRLPHDIAVVFGYLLLFLENLDTETKAVFEMVKLVFLRC